LSAFDLAAAEHTQRRHVADADEFRCGFERDLTARRPLAIAKDGNVVVIAEPRTRSCVQALPCPVSTPVRLSRRAI
jgi:hypothetical protein